MFCDYLMNYCLNIVLRFDSITLDLLKIPLILGCLGNTVYRIFFLNIW